MALKEEQIRPKALFDEYLALATEDARDLVQNGRFEKANCFACGAAGKQKFEKLGFAYAECPSCQTIFCDPRPCVEDLNRFYTEGKSTKFWATDFYRQTAEARRERLWKPKAAKILEIFNSGPHPFRWVCDVGGGYGIFAEEFAKITKGEVPVFVLEPGKSLAEACRSRGIPVREKFLEQATQDDFPATPGVVTSFELFEHLHNPREFVQRLISVIPSGSCFVMTTLSGLGLDIRLLGKHSKSVFPPHHLNFTNPFAVKKLFEELGFVRVQVTTPGELDLDILMNSGEPIGCDFWEAFLKASDPSIRCQMQETISKTGFSSHMWVVAVKP